MIHRLPLLVVPAIALVLSANGYSFCGVQRVEKENDGVLIRFDPNFNFSPESELWISIGTRQENQQYDQCKISKGMLKCRENDREYLLLKKYQTASVSLFHHEICNLTVIEKSNQLGVLFEEVLTFVGLPPYRSEVFVPAKE